MKFHILMDWDFYKFIFSQDFVPLPSRVPFTRQQGKTGRLDVLTTRATLDLPTSPFNSSLEDFFCARGKGPPPAPWSEARRPLFRSNGGSSTSCTRARRPRPPCRMIAKGEKQVFATAEKRELTGSSHKRLSRFPTESVLIEGAQGLLEVPFPRSENRKKEEGFCPCRVFISLVKNSVSASLVAF